MKDLKICEIPDVREYVEGAPVELRISPHGRQVLRAYNECGNNYTEVDLEDLLKWIQKGGAQLGTDDQSD